MTEQKRKRSAGTELVRPDRTAIARSKAPVSVVDESRISVLDRLKADSRGSIELAAAKLGARFERLIHMAVMARPDISQQDLAERLHVSAGRVSQILSGDENPRITTVARYLRALGYEVHVSLEPAEPDLPPVGRYWRAARREAVETSHIYVSFVTDGEATAPKFTVIPQSMSADHTAISPMILLGEMTEESIVGIRPAHLTTRPVVVGRSSGNWKPIYAHNK